MAPRFILGQAENDLIWKGLVKIPVSESTYINVLFEAILGSFSRGIIYVFGGLMED